MEDMGIQTPGDFHHCWASSQACFAELEAKAGRRLSAQEAMKAAVAWTNARRESLTPWSDGSPGAPLEREWLRSGSYCSCSRPSSSSECPLSN